MIPETVVLTEPSYFSPSASDSLSQHSETWVSYKKWEKYVMRIVSFGLVTLQNAHCGHRLDNGCHFTAATKVGKWDIPNTHKLWTILVNLALLLSVHSRSRSRSRIMVQRPLEKLHLVQLSSSSQSLVHSPSLSVSSHILVIVV